MKSSLTQPNITPTEAKFVSHELSLERKDTLDSLDSNKTPEQKAKDVSSNSQFLYEAMLGQDGFVETIRFPYDQAATSINYFNDLAVTAPYFPCELMAVTWRYSAKSSVANTGFVISKNTSASVHPIIGENNECLFTGNPNIVYAVTKKDFNIAYSFFTFGDTVTISSWGSDPTNLRDLSITFHFKYSGRGESRWG